MSVALERAPLRRSRRANEAVGSTTRLIQLGLTSFATRAVNSGAGRRIRRPATSLEASIDSPAMAPRYVAVCGQGAPDPEHEKNAREVGRLLARAGAVVLCGGRREGVMEAVSTGVREAGGTVIGILPGRDRSEASEQLTFALPTGLGEARNTVLTTAADSVIAIGRGWGTLSEIAFARKLGRTVVGLGSFELEGLVVAQSPEQAVRLAVEP
jgi:uncharacterized protein (TIGR00725 family)